jgi:hypothetical protein
VTLKGVASPEINESNIWVGAVPCGSWFAHSPASILLAGALLAWCPPAVALDPALDISQYAHTAASTPSTKSAVPARSSSPSSSNSSSKPLLAL